jgi:hypothetical protein
MALMPGWDHAEFGVDAANRRRRTVLLSCFQTFQALDSVRRIAQPARFALKFRGPGSITLPTRLDNQERGPVSRPRFGQRGKLPDATVD